LLVPEWYLSLSSARSRDNLQARLRDPLTAILNKRQRQSVGFLDQAKSTCRKTAMQSVNSEPNAQTYAKGKLPIAD
jgi:hypothetical protein